MSLDAVRSLNLKNDLLPEDANAVFAQWQYSPASEISHHGAVCCESARQWLTAMDYSLLNAADVLTGPRWIRQRYNWGPSGWAIFWCEALKRKTLDCGALAALAAEVYAARGVKSFRAQLIQQFSIEATNQWFERWDGEDIPVNWINGDLIYHEGNAVLTGDNQIKLWDASAGWWINPAQDGGYGSLAALRIFANGANTPENFVWGAHQIVPNQWQKL